MRPKYTYSKISLSVKQDSLRCIYNEGRFWVVIAISKGGETISKHDDNDEKDMEEWRNEGMWWATCNTHFTHEYMLCLCFISTSLYHGRQCERLLWHSRRKQRRDHWWSNHHKACCAPFEKHPHTRTASMYSLGTAEVWIPIVWVECCDCEESLC